MPSHDGRSPLPRLLASHSLARLAVVFMMLTLAKTGTKKEGTCQRLRAFVRKAVLDTANELEGLSAQA